VRYLLDTNAVIALLRGHDGVLARLRAHAPVDFGLSVVVLHELVYGAAHSARPKANLARVDALRFDRLPLTERDAAEAGHIRAALAQKGMPIGAYDLLIAGQARARGLAVVTRNRREFDRVDGLTVEDWES
jgi:tRNA(fMet)-specific endonuclease VapC